MPPPRLTTALLRAQRQTPLQCLHLRRIAPLRKASTSSSPPPPNQDEVVPSAVPWKTPHSVWAPENLIPPPKEGEILLERRPNRALPPVPPLIPRQITRTFPIFALAMTISILVFFNYQKQESSVVTSTLYALRTNPDVRAALGDEIYFASKYPWISGEINQVHGRIDISFRVKGTRREGTVRLRCRRRGRGGLYVTQEWSLSIDGGETLFLYDPEGNALDPFAELDRVD